MALRFRAFMTQSINEMPPWRVKSSTVLMSAADLVVLPVEAQGCCPWDEHSIGFGLESLEERG